MLTRRKIRNLTHFKNKKVDITKYLKDYYVDNDLAYISCNVDDYFDIIDSYSVVDYEDLNPDFVEFVEENAEHIPVEYPIVLEITGHRFTKKQQDIISETITDYYNMKLGDTQVDMQYNNRKCIIMTLLSLFCFSLYYILNVDYNYIFIIDFVTWYFIWRLAEIIIFDRTEIRNRKTSYAQLSSMKVIFREEFVDADVPITVEQKIIEEILSDDNESGV